MAIGDSVIWVSNRTSKKQHEWYSGRQKRHTAKTLLIIDMFDKQILAAAHRNKRKRRGLRVDLLRGICDFMKS